MSIDTTSFDTAPFGPEVVSAIFQLGLSEAPLFSSFTQRTTNRSGLSMPTANPSGSDWVSELGLIPSVTMNDDSAVVVPAKLAGLIQLSNEAVSDASLNVTSEVGRLIGESMAPKLDKDALYGDDLVPAANTASPPGYIPASGSAVDGVSLRASVIAAASAIMQAGGTPTHVAVSPAIWAAEVNRLETVPGGAGPLLGDIGIPLTVVVANTLKAADALVYDSSKIFAVTRAGLSIEVSTEAGSAWTNDAVSLRVKGRFGVLVPSPSKAIRRLTVTPEEPETP